MKKQYCAAMLCVIMLFVFVGCGQRGSATLAQYNRVQIGMTYSEVVRIFGAEENRGTRMGGNVVNTQAGSFRVQLSEVLTWNGQGGRGAAIITFRDGRVREKRQVGLQ